MRRWAVSLMSGVLLALLALPASADTAAYDIAFPPEWIVEPVEQPIASGPATISLRAYPESQSEECVVVDLGAAAVALDTLGVSDPQTYSRVAADLLGRGAVFVTTLGLGYSNPWAAYLEAEPMDGPAFSLYSYQRDDAWLVLECSSGSTFHQDWEQIAKTFSFED